MSVDDVTELCRLCFEKSNLVWIFDVECLKNIIQITTGVDVQRHDLVSTKICQKCKTIVLKMFQFRKDAMEKDKILKNRYKELVRNGGFRIPNTQIIIKSERHPKNHQSKVVSKLFQSIHPSVKEIFKEYPDLKLPNNCLRMDMAPTVSMQMDEVENFFKKPCISQTQVAAPLQTQGFDKTVASFQPKKEDDKIKTEPVCNTQVKTVVPNIVISPINIKLTNHPIAQYKIVKKGDGLKNEEMKFDLKRRLSSNDDPLNTSLPEKKRRSSESSTSSLERRATAKNTLIESLGLTPSVKKVKHDREDLVTLPCVERTLSVCNICNAVYYNERDLKRHQLKHLRCHFCKAKFKTMEIKEDHIQNKCPIKEVLYRVPDIILKRIEHNLELRQKYPNAFINFSPIPGLCVESSPLLEEVNSDDFVEHVTAENPEISNDVIEILSDDEESGSSSKKSDEQHVNVQVVEDSALNSENSERSNSSSSDSTNIGSDVPSKSSSEQKNVDSSQLPPNISSCVVKPDIRIKNNYVLDSINVKASDTMVLKELLKNYKKFKSYKDVAVQPELPSNTSVLTNAKEGQTTLKRLRHLLNFYRIPVQVKHGTYKVEFDYNPKKEKVKPMCIWNCMTPVDIKNNSLINQQATVSNQGPILLNNNSALNQWVITGNSGGTSHLQTLLLQPMGNPSNQPVFTLKSISPLNQQMTNTNGPSNQQISMLRNSLTQQTDTSKNSSSFNESPMPSNNGSPRTKTFILNISNPPKQQTFVSKNMNSTTNKQTAPKIISSFNQQVSTSQNRNSSSDQQTVALKNVSPFNQQVSTPQISSSLSRQTITLKNMNSSSSKQTTTQKKMNSSLHQQTVEPKNVSTFSQKMSTPQSSNSSSNQQSIPPKNVNICSSQETITQKNMNSSSNQPTVEPNNVSSFSQQVSTSQNSNNSSNQQSILPKNVNSCSSQETITQKHMNSSSNQPTVEPKNVSSFSQQVSTSQNSNSSTSQQTITPKNINKSSDQQKVALKNVSSFNQQVSTPQISSSLNRQTTTLKNVNSSSSQQTITQKNMNSSLSQQAATPQKVNSSYSLQTAAPKIVINQNGISSAKQQTISSTNTNPFKQPVYVPKNKNSSLRLQTFTKNVTQKNMNSSPNQQTSGPANSNRSTNQQVFELKNNSSTLQTLPQKNISSSTTQEAAENTSSNQQTVAHKNINNSSVQETNNPKNIPVVSLTHQNVLQKKSSNSLNKVPMSCFHSIVSNQPNSQTAIRNQVSYSMNHLPSTSSTVSNKHSSNSVSAQDGISGGLVGNNNKTTTVVANSANILHHPSSTASTPNTASFSTSAQSIYQTNRAPTTVVAPVDTYLLPPANTRENTSKSVITPNSLGIIVSSTATSAPVSSESFISSPSSSSSSISTFSAENSFSSNTASSMPAEMAHGTKALKENVNNSDVISRTDIIDYIIEKSLTNVVNAPTSISSTPSSAIPNHYIRVKNLSDLK